MLRHPDPCRSAPPALFGHRCGVKHWCGVALAMAGLYFLCMTGGWLHDGRPHPVCRVRCCSPSISQSSSHFSPMVDGVKMSHISFSPVDLIGYQYTDLRAAKPRTSSRHGSHILYAGAMSSGVGYTLQIVGQKGMNPALASLIMSLSQLSRKLHRRLAYSRSGAVPYEGLGCVLMLRRYRC